VLVCIAFPSHLLGVLSADRMLKEVDLGSGLAELFLWLWYFRGELDQLLLLGQAEHIP